jgi:hypothetical protein
MDDEGPHEVTSVAPARTGSSHGRIRRTALRGASLIGAATLLFGWLIYQASNPMQRVESGVITAIATDHRSHTYALIDAGSPRSNTGWQVDVSVRGDAFVLDAARYVRGADSQVGSQACPGLVFIAVSLPFGWTQYPMVDDASGQRIAIIDISSTGAGQAMASYTPNGCLPQNTRDLKS